jgi:hypothetical protein
MFCPPIIWLAYSRNYIDVSLPKHLFTLFSDLRDQTRAPLATLIDHFIYL